MKWFILFILFSQTLWAKEEVHAEPNNDIRGAKELYKIEWKEKKETIFLERSNGQEYQIKYLKKGQTTFHKCERQEAEKMDGELTLLFVDLQLENDFKLNCDYVMQVTLRGDIANLCPHNEKKISPMKSIWDRHLGLLK
jgi:hypothetical protein